MLIQQNNLASIQRTFEERLSNQYESSEIRAMFRMAVQKINGWSMMKIHLEPDTRVNQSDLLKYSKFLKRLRMNEPIQYILGNAWFCDLEIQVAPGVLIPRPETEELVMGLLERIENKESVILDACTGSGCIALALKNYLPQARILALELSEDALNIALQNSELLKLDIEFIQADLLAEIPDNIPKLDVIISNPPYIPYADKATMSPHVFEKEPEMALFVPDNDPMLFYRNLARWGNERLNENGFLFAESHSALTKEVEACWQDAGFENIEIHKDLGNLPRWLSAQKKS
jgi:release factor glutamine methyltransferase